MTPADVQVLAAAMAQHGITELAYEAAGVKLRLLRGWAPPAAAEGRAQTDPAAVTVATPAAGHCVPRVRVGDVVAAGTPVAVIAGDNDAAELEAGVAGTVVEVAGVGPVEAGAVIVRIKP